MRKAVLERGYAKVAKSGVTGKRIWCKLYGVWNAMRGRCNSPGTKDYKRYGARGIKVCEEWNDYHNFRVWALANGFRKGMTLDRIDNDGPYSPENCRWIPKGEQQANTRVARMLTINGETKSTYEWARIARIKATTINYRDRVLGWPHEKCVFHPVKRPAPSHGNGK